MRNMLHALPVVAIWVLLTSAGQAQLADGNAAGVAAGHVHYFVRDVAANTEFWVALGGTASGTEDLRIVRFSGLFIILSPGEPDGGSEGSVINHLAFRVASLDSLEAQGFDMEHLEQFPGIASVFTPEGERIELFDTELATNIGFDVAAGHDDPIAERHNRPLEGAIASHHLHFYLPDDQVIAARDWYVQHFGATPGQRWRYDAADLPGINLNFSARPEPQAPTRGRMLDHIGFEVENLEALCARLEAAGIEFDMPYTRVSDQFALAFFTDPWGVYVELTEGLASF